MSKVSVDVRSVSIPTYQVQKPERNPFFLEKRVYQGSSGKAYPLPFYNRVSEEKVSQEWEAIYIENEFIEVMILPQIGGRIHAARDKTNGYDFIYRQEVIKPALVGLAGPWISGGIEFNWPQHHRPATYMPVAYDIENHEDGSVTVWLSDHDPMQHLKGMHGVCLHPDKSFIELKVRAYNRTEYTQTFLWWANVATRVHEQYQSFFPTDVNMVADHAKRAMSTFPLCTESYYGVDYNKRSEEGVPEHEIPAKFIPPHCVNKNTEVPYKPNDLSWYANIPVPTSYMCIGSEGDFCGGYDHSIKAGIVHVANHHISPGKKQWTWGNHEFGYAWDRNLSDNSEPYIELMAGVYTDNQPDFSYLMPGETKTWSQYFYPYSGIGTVKQADKDFALNMEVKKDVVLLGVSATSSHEEITITLKSGENTIYENTTAITPKKPFIIELPKSPEIAEDELELHVTTQNEKRTTLQPVAKSKKSVEHEAATEPPAPSEIASCDELYITGLHLQQYRHATRSPEIYWEEALKRDPLDARCNNAMGLRCFNRGQLEQAQEYFRNTIKRLTQRNPNPYDGEPYYNLGLTLRLLGKTEEAYAALYKATWNMAWRAPAYHALAELDARKKDWTQALEHLEYSLRYNTENLRARNLKVMILRKIGHEKLAEKLLAETRAIDKLDIWSRHLSDLPCLADSQGRIDLTLDLARAGFYNEAIKLLLSTNPESVSGTGPTLFYLAAWLEQKLSNTEEAEKLRKQAEGCDMSYCFPIRLEEMLALEEAMKLSPENARAAYYLGNLYYDRKRHEDAIVCWLKAVEGEPDNAIAWRNIGIGAYNSRHNVTLALDAYNKAVELDPTDPRLLYERDQLWKRAGILPQQRLDVLMGHQELLDQRDELLLEYCTLLNQLGRPDETAAKLYTHNFQPWEGGEGMALGLHVRLNLLLGQKALAECNPVKACHYFEKALSSPENLGEAKHLIANQSDIHYWLGLALSKNSDIAKARKHWQIAAETKGDFQTMEVRQFSEMTYYSALSMKQLGQVAEANKLLKSLKEYAEDLMTQKAKIDYFATSLPNMLLFDEDLDQSQQIRASFLKAQACYGTGDTAQALDLCQNIVKKDPSHALASDFLTMIAQESTNS